MSVVQNIIFDCAKRIVLEGGVLLSCSRSGGLKFSKG